MVVFEIYTEDQSTCYTEKELFNENTLWKLKALAAHSNGQLNGRLRFDVSEQIQLYCTDNLTNLIGGLCANGIRNLKLGKEALFNFCSRFGTLLLKPLGHQVIISGSLEAHEEQLGATNSAVVQKNALLIGFKQCIDRFNVLMQQVNELAVLPS